jgi:hypothetical protein
MPIASREKWFASQCRIWADTEGAAFARAAAGRRAEISPRVPIDRSFALKARPESARGGWRSRDRTLCHGVAVARCAAMSQRSSVLLAVVAAAAVLVACGGPGGSDGGSGGGSGGSGGGAGCNASAANSWSLGAQCWTAGETKCEARSGKSVMEAVALNGAFTVWFPAPVTAAGSYTIIPLAAADGGNAIPGATEAQLSMAASINGGSLEGILATSGTVTTTVNAGKATASFTNVTLYQRDGGLAGQASGQVSCP